MTREKVILPVIDMRKYPQKWYYVVEYEGNTYQVQLMPFQRAAGERPEKIACLIERNPSTGTMYIKQDFEPLLAERYKAGQLYEFTIEDDYTNTTTPHYKVADGSGFWFKLYSKRRDDFRRGVKVRCRVTRVAGVSVSLEAVACVGDDRIAVLTPAEIAGGIGEDMMRVLTEYLENEPLMAESLRMLADGDYNWVFRAIDAAWSTILNRCRHDCQQTRRAVEALRSVLIYLLEDTRYLNTLDLSVRSRAQSHISLLTARSEDLLAAIDIVEEGTEQDYISHVLNKMEASGYLYRPEQKLRIMMYIFALRTDSMDVNMGKLLEIIHEGRRDNWSAEPFRSAFVGQLELYVDANHSHFDRLPSIGNPGERERLDKVLQALSIQQLLADERDKGVNTVINRSRLYRYFTFRNRFEEDRLLDKALVTVRSRSVASDEFCWEETARIDSMTSRMLKPLPSCSSSMYFEVPDGIFEAGDGRLTLSSSRSAGRPAIPAELNLWNSLTVNLDEPLPAALRNPSKVSDYKQIWTEIERSFFSRETATVSPAQIADTRRMPDIGDEVSVIVDGINPENESELHCTVVAPGFSGQGWIMMKEITNMERPAPLSSFRNSNGQPYILTARVTAVEGEDLRFTMRPGVCRMISDLVRPGNVVDGVITYANRAANRYIAFTEFGYSVFVNSEGHELKPGTNLRLEVTDVKGDGNVVYGRCQHTTGVPIVYADAVQALMLTYSDERVYEAIKKESPEPEEDVAARSADEMLTGAETAEIMHIVGRKGDVEEDLVKRYNYHAFARMLARMLGLEADIDYFSRRCAVIEILDDFATNGQVDPERLEAVSREHADSLTSTIDGRKLLLLSMLDRPECNGDLWQAAENAENDLIGSLARLVLAYNLLDGYKMGGERTHIRAEIHSLLNLREDVRPEQIEGGLEGQKVEFKTSAIYPPGPRVRQDVKAQTAEIVEKIVGMLNADGGRIYIGVSDDGYIRGLAPDMEFFGNRDRFELNLRNAITFHCGFIPNGNNHIVTSWESHAGKDIYVIDITPVSEPVAFDGVYYQRQGTSNRFVPQQNVGAFLAARRGSEPAAEQPVSSSVADTERETAPAQSASNRRGVIATTALRPNVLHDGYEGYQPVSAYLYFPTADSIQVSDQDLWTEDDMLLTLALTDGELDGELLMVYASGVVSVAPMRFAIKNFEKEPRRLRKNDPLVFAAPIRADQGMILYGRDESGNLTKQAFRPETLPRVGMLKGQGERLMKDMTPVWAEIIPADRLATFAGIMRNGQKIKTTLVDDVASHTEPRLGFTTGVSSEA